MANPVEIQSLEEGDRIRWAPDPPFEGTVVAATYDAVAVRWDDNTHTILAIEHDRRWAYIEVEQAVRDRSSSHGNA